MKTQILFTILFLGYMGVFGQDVYTFSGDIKDARTGECIEGANIFITEKNTGTISDYSGSFFVFLSEGKYSVNFSADGYATETVSLNLSADKNAEVLLNPVQVKKRKTEVRNKKKDLLPSEITADKEKDL